MPQGYKPREPRQKVVLPARMRAGAGQVDICIRDVSSRGMLIQTGAPPPRGTYVEILRPGCVVTGRVVWSKQHKFGIISRDKIRIADVIERRKVPRPDGGTAPLNQGGGPVRLSPVADPAASAERARARAAFFQYAAVGAAVAVVALLIAVTLFRSLADISANVARHLN